MNDKLWKEFYAILTHNKAKIVDNNDGTVSISSIIDKGSSDRYFELCKLLNICVIEEVAQ